MWLAFWRAFGGPWTTPRRRARAVALRCPRTGDRLQVQGCYGLGAIASPEASGASAGAWRPLPVVVVLRTAIRNALSPLDAAKQVYRNVRYQTLAFTESVGSIGRAGRLRHERNRFLVKMVRMLKLVQSPTNSFARARESFHDKGITAFG